MRKPILYSFFSLLLLPVHFTSADQNFSMDDITQALQTEYQSQLVLYPQAKIKTPVRKKASIKRPRSVVRHIPQAPRRAAPPIKHSQQAAKAPAPDADSLFDAATNGNVQQIGLLLRQGININIANNERETALHMAAARGHYSAVIYLVSHGANIHSRTIKNWLPIHHATRFRHANIANYLKQRGSSPHARTSDGLSAIDMARTIGDRRLLGVFGVR